MVYVEARMAEQNYRRYNWPIPKHLHSAVAAISPDLKHNFTSTAVQTTANGSSIDDHPERSSRVAAGQGKLQEVDLGPDTASRTHEDWKRLEGEAPASKIRLGRDGKPRRGPKRRNSDDIRRDQMVEAVLREAKCTSPLNSRHSLLTITVEFFDEAPTNPYFAGTDEDMVERFRTEYLESMDERQHRKPVMPSGAKDQPKGPKLGGSRSARAAMRQQEEQAVKTKR